METTANSGMCRCCASEGLFKDVNTTYHWMGEDEVYADMLHFCFDITLASAEGQNNGGICEVCITQLRNAANFKKQVQHTEEQFKKRLAEVNSFKPEVIKVEMSAEDGAEFDNNLSEDYQSGPEFEVPIKEESPEPKAKKRTAKATTSKAKKAKTDSGETSTKRRTGEKKTRRRAINEEIDDQNLVNNTVFREKHLPEMQKQWHNLTTLLKYSNATPFKDRNDAGYICAYCFKTYPDPDVLRNHTQYDHVKEKPTYKAGSGMSNFVAFLDVVNLKCTICDQPIDNLKILMEHLVKEHDKKYYLGLTDYFQPFKLTSEQQINCCLCNEVFHNMKLLMQHMNTHYRNFICTTCGAGFVNSFRLNRHETTHGKKKSSFPCRQCGQVFAAESKKKAHVNTEHKGIAGYSVCQICKARFKNYYQKTRHMVQIHNVEGIKCDMCDKKFNLKSNLMLHMRSVHLKERSYECSVCNMGFFIKRHMLGHYLATHTNERKFKCDVCGKAYATQNSKRKHMKKNHGISKNNSIVSNVPK